MGKSTEQKEKSFIKYSDVSSLLTTIKGLPVNSYGEYESVKSVVKVCEDVNQEYQGKIKEVLDKHGVTDVKPNDPKYPEIINEINGIWVKDSSFNAELVKLFSKEDLHAKVDGMNLNFDQRDILEKYLA